MMSAGCEGSSEERRVCCFSVDVDAVAVITKKGIFPCHGLRLDVEEEICNNI